MAIWYIESVWDFESESQGEDLLAYRSFIQYNVPAFPGTMRLLSIIRLEKVVYLQNKVLQLTLHSFSSPQIPDARKNGLRWNTNMRAGMVIKYFFVCI
jgi:hypothetical protein